MPAQVRCPLSIHDRARSSDQRLAVARRQLRDRQGLDDVQDAPQAVGQVLRDERREGRVAVAGGAGRGREEDERRRGGGGEFVVFFPLVRKSCGGGGKVEDERKRKRRKLTHSLFLPSLFPFQKNYENSYPRSSARPSTTTLKSCGSRRR